jgi:hypothetical protein
MCPCPAGTPVQFTQNLDPVVGLVKGECAMVTSCQRNSVQVKLANGTTWRVPRTTHLYKPSHFHDTIEVSRHQLPLAVNFASTVHRVQGDSLQKVLIDLRSPIFAHGQLYTALSRVHSRRGLRCIIPEEDYIFGTAGNHEFICKNIVFHSVLKYADVVRSSSQHIDRELIIYFQHEDYHTLRICFLCRHNDVYFYVATGEFLVHFLQVLCSMKCCSHHSS